MLLYKRGNLHINKSERQIAQSVEKEYGFRFSEHTTYGLGGRADVAYYPENFLQASAVYRYLVAEKIPFVVLGKGSDVLVSDRGFHGAVVCTEKLTGIVRLAPDRIFCLAGTSVSALLAYCRAHSLGGLEYLGGIPASIGGIVCMNAGAGGTYVESNVVSVKVCMGKIVNFSRKNCNFSKKHSTMRDINCLILGAELSVLPSSGEVIRQNTAFYRRRRAHLPSGRSCGCVFKNPDGLSAGKLIDDAGLKGKRIGGAVVSERHANFILNTGGSAEDVASLIRLVKREVYRVHGVSLDEEVVYIGEFNDSYG